MKSKLIILLFVSALGRNYAQMSCCSKPGSTETFAMLTQDENFISSHLEPEPFVLEDQMGKSISFKTPDGKEGYGYEIKAEKPSNKYIFVIHEWWGLNDYIKQESERFYKTLGDVNVIAIDLYDKKVTANRDSAGKFMGAVKTERAEAIIKGALAYAGTKASIATVGWCFGGGWSLQASILAGKQSKACVMYYGMPEEKMEKLKKLNAPVMMIWPSQDKWINKEVVEKFEENMKTVNKKLNVVQYNADHAFANPSNPKYSKEMADDAFKNATTLIKANLK